ncbi:MAG: universal stress protein [Bacillota bacterium]|nr:universal stress protein [Bacillota bacterium]
MFKILVATDGSEHARKVVNDVIKIAAPIKAEVIVLTVEDWTAADRDAGAKAKDAVEKAVTAFKENDITVSPLIRKGTKRAADVIIEVADEENVDLIVLGSRGLRGVKEVFLGSVSHRVVHMTDKNVMVIK